MNLTPTQALGHPNDTPTCHPGQVANPLPADESCRAGAQPMILQRDLTELLPQFDCLVIGPGPTDPIRAGLIDVVKQAAALKVPTLGICLGHQAIGLAFGAQLIRTHPVHGKRSEITFSRSRLFPNIIGKQTVMRYHSLSLSDIASPLCVIAITDDGIPMAIEHESLPIAGLQFHPDSYATEQGREMLTDFFEAIR